MGAEDIFASSESKKEKTLICSTNQLCQLHIMLQHLARGHEEGEEEDEVALGHWQPVSLLHGEEDRTVQTGFGRAAEMRDIQCQ